MGIGILLIAMEDWERNIYGEAIRGLGVEVNAAPSLKELDEEVKGLYFHGVVIDMPSKIYALKNDRRFIYSTLRKFPAAHVSLEKESRQIKVFYSGQKPGATLVDFIEDKCRSSVPHRLGYHIRKEIHYNVILSKEMGAAMENSEQTVTVDVSERGCFLFSVQDWAPGETAWLTVMELSDRTPIGAEVRRRIKWGTPMHIPGIGVEFKTIKESQAREISKTLWS